MLIVNNFHICNLQNYVNWNNSMQPYYTLDNICYLPIFSLLTQIHMLYLTTSDAKGVLTTILLYSILIKSRNYTDKQAVNNYCKAV